MGLSHSKERLLVSGGWQSLALLTHLGVCHEGNTLLSALPLLNSQVELGWKKHNCGCPLESPREKKIK